MNEPKLLPPSMRSHKRYVVFEIISEKPVDYNDFVAAFWATFLNFMGEHGAAEAQIWLIKNLYDLKQQCGVIKCRHDYAEHLRTSLMLISIIGETKAVVHAVGVTGTIKAAKAKYLSITE